jgi:uncharacterized repeat protein (TIGR02543 family)
MRNAVLSVLFIAGILLTACFDDEGGGGGLAAPTNLTAVPSSPTSIALTWTEVSGAAKYKIYRSETSLGQYQYVDETGRNDYVVNGLVANSTYYFKVSSVDTSGIEGPQSVYAQGTTQPAPNYTITFDVNGGNGDPPAPQMVSGGTTITLPTGNGLSRTNYIFGGWNTSSAGTGIPYSAGSSYTVLGNATLYAMWNDPNATYTVTFNANSGSGTPPAPVTQSAGYSFNLPSGSGLTRSGYNFAGWSTSQTSGSGTTYNAGSSYTISGDITLFAVWNESNTPVTDNVPGYTLDDKFNWLQGNAQTDGEYNIVLNANASLSDKTLSYSGKNNITIRLWGTGSTRTVSLSSYNGWIIIGTGVTLVLENNITIKGYYSSAVVRVNSFGTLIMNGGSTVTNGGNGVSISENGIFIMNGGSVSDNSSSGVYVNGGIFTMNSGTISGNKVGSNGGGVDVNSGTFTMKGGSIFGNTASGSSARGGGVDVGTNGTFNMSGGTISSNTVTYSSNSNSLYGGGVYVRGKFTKTGGGTIYAYSAGDSNSNVVGSGSVTYRGHAVFAYHDSGNWKGIDTFTVVPSANLSYDGSTGEYTGTWDF